MNDLHFNKRTRAFFSVLRKKYRTFEHSGPIQDRFGTLSRNLPETLKNWADFYARLYTNTEVQVNHLTKDEDPNLDKEFTDLEFLDSIYALNSHKAPGFDHITSEDIISLLPNDSIEDEENPKKKISSLRLFLKF